MGLLQGQHGDQVDGIVLPEDFLVDEETEVVVTDIQLTDLEVALDVAGE